MIYPGAVDGEMGKGTGRSVAKVDSEGAMANSPISTLALYRYFFLFPRSQQVFEMERNAAAIHQTEIFVLCFCVCVVYASGIIRGNFFKTFQKMLLVN